MTKRIYPITFLLVAACGDDDGAAESESEAEAESESESESESEAPFAPDLVCPGGEGCADAGDGTLRAGAGIRGITPPFFETWENRDADLSVFSGNVGEDPDCPLSANIDGKPLDCERDCGSDPGNVCGSEDEDTDDDCFHDDDGDGCFDAVWIAGFGEGRAANGVHEDDGIWARCTALDHDSTRVVLCAVDFIGYFLDDIEAIRATLDPAWNVDLLLVSATHVHEGPDVLGIWGPEVNLTGADLGYMAWVREQVKDAVGDAVATLTPVHVTFGKIDTVHEDGTTTRWVGDSREPIIYTPELHVFRFADAKTDETVSTIINWAAHPEYTGSDNLFISSDYPHYLRTKVEAELGGMAEFISGPLGGQIGPGEVWAEDPDDLCPELHDPDHDGRVHTYGFCKAQLIGEQVADFVLEALEEGSVTEETAALSFRTVQTYGQIQNTFYHAAGQLGVFPRALYHYDRDEPIDFDVNGTPLGEIADGNLPDLKTELATLRIGPAQIVTVPGELHPELYLGCYDVDGEGRGDCSYGETVVFPDGVGEGAEEGAVRPDLSKAPPPPYLIDLTDDDAEFRMVFGLTSDMIGYIMPLFNFALDPSLPYIEEAPGDHYEETNSIGPTAETQVIATLRKLLCWSEDGTLSEPCQQLSDWGWTPPVE